MKKFIAIAILCVSCVPVYAKHKDRHSEVSADELKKIRIEIKSLREYVSFLEYEMEQMYFEIEQLGELIEPSESPLCDEGEVND